MKDSFQEPDESIQRLSVSLRALALVLVGDRAEAEDLVQDAWVAALAAPRQTILDLRRWMRRVVLRGASHRRRREANRSAVEGAVARSEAVLDRAAAEWRSSVQLLMDALSDLEEPYRSVLRARFFEQRSVADVARSFGVPKGTVKTWTHRGIERLRVALTHRSGGDREAWAIVLLPLTDARRHASEARAGPSAALATTGAVLVAAGVISSIALLSRAERRAPLAEPVAEVARAVEDRIEASTAAVDEPPASRPARTPVLAGAEASEASSAGSGMLRLRIHVVDGAGADIEGATVVLFSNSDELARVPTGPDGKSRAELDASALDPLPGDDARRPTVRVIASAPGLASSDEHLVTLLAGEETQVRIELLGGARAFAARLVDGSGDPVADARVIALTPDRSWRVIEGGVLVGVFRPTTRSDVEGRFAFEHLQLDTRELEVIAPDFVPLRIPLPEDPEPPLAERTYVLEHGGELFGELRYADGRPAAGALVRLELLPRDARRSSSTQADERGWFLLRGIPAETAFVFASAPEDPELWAVRRVHGGRRPLDEWTGSLDRRPSISVLVVDERGEPLAGRKLLLGVTFEGALWLDHAITGGGGLARFHPVPDSVFQIRVLGMDGARTERVDALVDDVKPSEQEYRIEVRRAAPLAPARISLGARRLDGAPAGGAQLLAFCQHSTSEHRAQAREEDGRLELSPVEPGRYTLRLLFPERGLLELGDHELGAGEQLELGTLIAPEGLALELEPLSDTVAGGSVLELVVLYHNLGVLHREGVSFVEPARGTRLRIVPGEYELRSPGGPARAVFRVEPGSTGRIELQPPPAR